MSDLLSIGASGVRAYQTALGTTSDNIANAGTAGYTRRTTDMREVSAVGGGGVNSRVSSDVYGVTVAGISRGYDQYKTANVRSAGADLASTETSATWLTNVQSALTGNQLGDRLTSFFNAAQTLSPDPTSSAARGTMLESANTLAQSFGATGRALDQVGSDLDANANQAVTTLNSLGTALAKVNGALSRTAPGGSAVAQLSDQRDQILEQMSAISDVHATFDESGRTTVRLGTSTGTPFVVGDSAGRVSYARNSEGAVSYSMLVGSDTTSAVTPSGGALAGYADAAQRTADARASLSDLAKSFVTGVNQVQAQGRDLSGAAGQPLFSIDSTATDISVTLTDPAGIAAASPGTGTRNNGNLLALQNLRTSANYEGKVTGIVAGNAATIASRQTVASAQNAIRDTAVAARDAVGGVNLDQEAVDLLRFQQAYQASSRVIQVARETMQSILDIR